MPGKLAFELSHREYDLADVGGGGLAGRGGLIEVAVDEAGAECGEDRARLGGVGTEAHGGDGPVAMIDEEGGKMLEVCHDSMRVAILRMVLGLGSNCASQRVNWVGVAGLAMACARG